jgi:HAD superfamily hydrolase (TIGR01509 family)
MGSIQSHSTVDNGSTITVREVFFDFEGTLVDFQWQLAPAVEACLADLVAAGFERRWFGPSPSYASIYNDARRFALEGRGQAPLDRVMHRIDAIYDKYDADALTRWQRYPDTLDMLTALGKAGFQMGLVSNVGRKALVAAMQRLELTGRLAVVISRNEVNHLKPHAEGLLQAAVQLGVDPAHAILIGDSRNDVAAARGAGMLAGYLCGGEDSPQAMREYPADIEIDRLGELPSRLKRMASPAEG